MFINLVRVYTEYAQKNGAVSKVNKKFISHLTLALAPRPRSKHEKRTAGSARETWSAAAADGVRCASAS
jgi:phage/plasmid-associated DNA primase